MRKFLMGIMVAVIVIAYAGNIVQAANGSPLITPANNFLWNFKLLGEWAWQNVVSIGGLRREAEMNYLAERYRERLREIDKMDSTGQLNETAHNKALGKARDLNADYLALLKQEEEKRRLEQLRKDSFLQYDPISPQEHYALDVKQNIDQARQQILDAQKKGDNAEVNRITTRLNYLQKAYRDSNIVLPSYLNDYIQTTLNEVDNMLAGADKVNYALEWADKYKKMINAASKNELYKGNDDLFAKANQAIDNLTSDLKKIPLDQVDNKKLDDLMGQARKTLNDTARAIWDKATPEETAQVPAVQTNFPPEPVPKAQQAPSQKQILKKIPSTATNAKR